MHDVTLVYTEIQPQVRGSGYWGKELLTQQLTGSSTQTQPCDNAMSMQCVDFGHRILLHYYH